LINVHNQENLDGLLKMIENFEIVFWEVFFLVPVGRGREIPLMEKDKFKLAFEKIYDLHKRVNFIIKITEAPQYRQYFIERQLREQGIDPAASNLNEIHLPDFLRKQAGPRGSIGNAPSGVNSGKGFVFVSHNGEVMPSGFLPIAAGNIKQQSLASIYQNAPVFKELRDSSLLKGKCGICSYREVCGGSRARAYAMTGDYLAEDPCCFYEIPAAYKGAE